MEINEKDILKTIQEQNNNVAVPSLTVPEIPASIQEKINDSRENRAGISIATTIRYESLTGHLKTRDFLIRRVIEKNGEYFLEGLAMDIQSPRFVRVQLISYIQDKISGQIYSNPYQFLQNVLGIDIDDSILPEAMSDFAKAIKETGNELTVLMYLVAIDGVRSSVERERVLAYVHRRVPYLKYDEAQMNDYLISLAPDDDSFSMAFHRILRKGILVIQPLMEAILSIIVADGQVHPKERALLARLIDLLKQAGYEFKLPEE